MACLGYVRVSTDRQADEGQSLGAQQRVIQGYAMQQGWTVDEIFVECGVSGSTPLAERPQGQRSTRGRTGRDLDNAAATRRGRLLRHDRQAHC